jgi:hypothetical protein
MAAECGFISAHLARSAPGKNSTFGEPTLNILHRVADVNL